MTRRLKIMAAEVEVTEAGEDPGIEVVGEIEEAPGGKVTIPQGNSIQLEQ